MKLHTASEVISFLRLLENEAAELYERAEAAGKNREDFEAFARENRRFVVQVQQAYNNVISDALEGGFAFDIEEDEFGIRPLKSGAVALDMAIEMENRLANLYLLASNQCQSLLPDVSRAMRAIARRRESRIAALRRISQS